MSAAPPLRYGLGLLACGVALLAAILLRPLLDPAYSLPFIAAAAITACYVGLGPALVASGVGFLGGALLAAGTANPRPESPRR